MVVVRRLSNYQRQSLIATKTLQFDWAHDFECHGTTFATCFRKLSCMDYRSGYETKSNVGIYAIVKRFI